MTVEGDPVCHLYMSVIFLKWTRYNTTSQCCQCSIYRHALINSDLKNDIKMILLHERLDMDMYTFEYEIIVHVMTLNIVK